MNSMISFVFCCIIKYTHNILKVLFSIYYNKFGDMVLIFVVKPSQQFETLKICMTIYFRWVAFYTHNAYTANVFSLGITWQVM